LAEAIRTTYSLYASVNGKVRYGDKTPVYVMAIGPIASLLPESKFVHIVRDGRDGALSYQDVPWGPGTVEEAAFRWRRAVNAAKEAARMLASQRYFELRYEDLVHDPERVIHETCEFVGLPFDKSMLSYFKRADEVIAPMGVPAARAGLYKPVTKGLRHWATQMPDGDVARFEAIASSALSLYGYPLKFGHIGLRAKLAAWSKVARVLLIERVRRIVKKGNRGPELGAQPISLHK
jgi:hypothetical protein